MGDRGVARLERVRRVYLALAVALDVSCVTADRRLSRALRGSDLAERVGRGELAAGIAYAFLDW
jgi:hypothetical protein